MRKLVLGVLGAVVLLVGVAFGWFVSRAFSQPAPDPQPLPDHLVALSAPEGQQWLTAAKRADHDALRLQTQQRPAWCGVATSSMLLTALGRPVAQDALFTPEAEAVHSSLSTTFGGMTLEQFGGLLQAHGATVEVVHAGDGSVDAFRAALAGSGDASDFVAVNYQRGELGQGRMGHISPIGAFDPASDRVLIEDVATYKYPPTWVDVDDLFAAMNTVDPSADATRGWVVVR